MKALVIKNLERMVSRRYKPSLCTNLVDRYLTFVKKENNRMNGFVCDPRYTYINLFIVSSGDTSEFAAKAITQNLSPQQKDRINQEVDKLFPLCEEEQEMESDQVCLDPFDEHYCDDIPNDPKSQFEQVTASFVEDYLQQSTE